MTILRICSPAPLRDRNTKVCMWGEVPDVITPIKFDVDRFRGFRSLRVLKSWFSIDKASRPYNSSALPCRLWFDVFLRGVCRCKKSSASVKSLQQSREILLAVLSHDTEAVRLRAYRAMYSVVKVWDLRLFEMQFPSLSREISHASSSSSLSSLSSDIKTDHCDVKL